ncbi:MAG: hypothetical protein IJF47_04680, partial [Candidatus Methanomethylophilaceae archaeon]|nr:hypothetical protein [Candidatus Methanomethylophilaceae archaeon]
VTEWSNDLSILSSFGTTAGTVKDADNKYGIAGIELEFYSNDKMVYETVTSLDGSFSVVLKSGSYNVKVTDPNGVYTFGNDGQTQVSVSSGVISIKANEQEYTGGKVIDGNNKPIINSDITVKAVDVDGNVVGSIAEVDAYGDYVIITDYTKAVKLITTDADGKYTFDDVYRSGTVTNPTFNLTIPANEAVYTVTVKDKANDPIVGADVEILLGNAADGFQTVVSDAVTDKDGKVEAFLVKPEAGDKYQAKVPSFGMGLSIDAVDFSDVNVDLKSDVYLRTVTIKSAANVVIEEAGYIMTVFNDITGDEVGKVTTDSKGVMKFYSANDALTVSIQSPEGSKYTFKDNVVLSLTDVVTSTGTSILAKQTLYSGLVKTWNEVNLEGVKVTLFNNKKEIVGEGITDADGKYEVVAIGAKDAVAADAELDIGTFGFPDEAKGLMSGKQQFETIWSNERLYSGYYANGAVIKDVEVSYMDSGVKSLAKVIDNKYYIVTKTNLPSTTEVTATAPNFNAKGTLTAADVPLVVGDVPTYDAYFMLSMGAQILGPYTDVAYGTVLTLVAQNEYSIGVPEEDGVIQKYKFAGWYVNGEKVSDELIYAYTVEGDCTIYADYKVSSYVAAPADESNGLSMDVLVLGIVIVVLGLLAFAYAVKFKKE